MESAFSVKMDSHLKTLSVFLAAFGAFLIIYLIADSIIFAKLMDLDAKCESVTKINRTYSRLFHKFQEENVNYVIDAVGKVNDTLADFRGQLNRSTSHLLSLLTWNVHYLRQNITALMEACSNCTLND